MKKIYQFSTIGALMSGHHKGEFHVPIGAPGYTFGLGCSDHVNGEVTIRNGIAYRATAQEPVGRLTEKDVTPFLQLTDFHPQHRSTETVTEESVAALLKKYAFPQNTFHVVQISGTFDKVVFRRPQRIGDDATRTMIQLAADQQVDALEHITGHLVGMWTPAIFGRLSVPGFHFHFVDDSGTKSGHVLSFKGTDVEFAFEEKSTIEIAMPTSEAYKTLDVNLESLDAVIQKVEK